MNDQSIGIEDHIPQDQRKSPYQDGKDQQQPESDENNLTVATRYLKTEKQLESINVVVKCTRQQFYTVCTILDTETFYCGTYGTVTENLLAWECFMLLAQKKYV